MFQSAELHISTREKESPTHCVADRLGLFVDLLEHEMIESATLDLVKLERQSLNRIPRLHIVERPRRNPIRGYHRHLAIFKVAYRPSVLDERRRIR